LGKSENRYPDFAESEILVRIGGGWR